MKQKPLEGTVALVTGALRGIGLAAARRLAAEGARVVFTDLTDDDDALVAAGLDGLEGCAYFRADVGEEADWQALRDHVQRDFGRLDILVNNAGIDCTGPVHELSLDKWRRLMRVNLDGVFLGVKSFAEMLRDAGADRAGGASIVNISSIMGLVGYADTSAYNTSKGAVRLFTKATAIEFAEKAWPIRVNSVHPGFVETPLLREGMKTFVAAGKAGSVQEVVEGVGAATPIGRVARAEEIAAGVMFLASSESSYMTGSELVIDGGWTAR